MNYIKVWTCNIDTDLTAVTRICNHWYFIEKRTMFLFLYEKWFDFNIKACFNEIPVVTYAFIITTYLLTTFILSSRHIYLYKWNLDESILGLLNRFSQEQWVIFSLSFVAWLTLLTQTTATKLRWCPFKTECTNAILIHIRYSPTVYVPM